MPSTELESARFTSIDWAEESGGWRSLRLRTVGLVAALLLVAVLFTYDYVAAPRELFEFMDWDVTRMDWLFLVSTVLFVRYALVPLAINRDRSSAYVREFVRRPAGVLSLGYIVFFGVMGVVGPEWFGLARVNFYATVQPPVFTSVYAENIRAHNCVGKMVENQCHGTWKYPLGTTRVGEDMVKLIVYAIRIGLKLALSAAMIMVVIATAVGTAAGYFGGWVDDVLMRYVDVQQTSRRCTSGRDCSRSRSSSACSTGAASPASSAAKRSSAAPTATFAPRARRARATSTSSGNT